MEKDTLWQSPGDRVSPEPFPQSPVDLNPGQAYEAASSRGIHERQVPGQHRRPEDRGRGGVGGGLSG
jgi:hypothetical protein